jgi:enoyl-CoA hydratase/carnithine racemase
MSDEVLFETREDGRLAIASLNRGAKRNSFSPALSAALLKVLGTALTDASHVFLLRSAVPGIFCAGFDISYLDTPEEESGEEAMKACFAAIEGAAKVTVAFANGNVFGGGNELFLSADLRLATPDTVFRITPARLGVVYSLPGLTRFLRAMGLTATMEMLVAAQPMSAEEALRIGLVTRIVPDEEAALAYCRRVAHLAPLAQRAMKASIKRLVQAATPPVSEAERRQVEALAELAHRSEDRREGKRAFMEKREPIFTGR